VYNTLKVKKETLVTGSSGFIGSHLVERLDNFRSVPHSEIQTTDFSNAERVFFLSSYGNMSHHKDTDEIVKANVTDLIHVLSSVDMDNIKSFVFISTSSVKRRVQTVYSRTKRASEEILLSYLENHNLPITIIRPLSVTGSGEQKEHLIPKLIDSCKNGTWMDFVEAPVHDFIDVDDLVEGILVLSENQARGVFELGTGIKTSNKEVREIVEELTGKQANVRIVGNLRAYDDTEWVSENFRAKRYGWKPLKTLKQSISEMI